MNKIKIKGFLSEILALSVVIGNLSTLKSCKFTLNRMSQISTNTILEDDISNLTEETINDMEIIYDDSETTIFGLDTKPEETINVDLEIPSEDLEISTEETILEETTPSKEYAKKIIAYPVGEVTLMANNNDDAIEIGTLQADLPVQVILSCNNSWDLVRQGNKIGYVHFSDLEYTSDIVESIYHHQLKKDIAITTERVNLKTDPTDTSQTIKEVWKNTELQVIAEIDNGWYLVRNNMDIGYVQGEYLDSVLAKAQAAYPELNLTELDVKKVFFSTPYDVLFIRCGNSTDYEKIGGLERLETVRVLGEYDDWYFAMTNDYNFGFVHKDYTNELTDCYSIVDKSEQKLWMYKNNQLYFFSLVTTGKDSTPTDTGLTEIIEKTEGRYLIGADYKQWVDHWAQVNWDEEGFHDSNRPESDFGSEIYHTNGSHGCINIPPAIIAEMFDYLSVGDKVLIHT